MAYEILMPQLSDSMDKGKLISWKVSVGDSIKVGDVIAEVESDKAIMEVQSFQDGTLQEILAKEGEEVEVGKVIARIQTDTTPLAKAEPTPKPKQQEKPNIQPTTKPKGTDQDLKEPKSDTSTTPATNLATASPKAKLSAKREHIDIQTLQQQNKLPTPTHQADIKKFVAKRYFTPKAYSLIEEYGIDSDNFELTHKYKSSDIKEYITKHNIPKIIPLTPNQQSVIKSVNLSATKPVYHIYDEIDSNYLESYSDEVHTMSVWLLKLISVAMRKHPSFRSRLKDDTSIELFDSVSVCVAMSVDGRLYMPVIKDIEHLSILDISSKLQELKSKAKNNKLTPQDMQGSTFGISNLGMTGIKSFDAMINGDDCGIVAIGSSIDGKISVSLSLDHRLINGFEGALFMQTLKSLAKDKSFFKGVYDEI